jgi:cadmium resistance protein CadD (predicted permease)
LNFFFFCVKQDRSPYFRDHGSAGGQALHCRTHALSPSADASNYADDISIYIPLYATFTNSGKVTMTIVFLLMTAVWCFIAYRLSNHPIIKMSLEKYGHIVAPLVFILLGIYIMYESKTFDLFINN